MAERNMIVRIRVHTTQDPDILQALIFQRKGVQSIQVDEEPGERYAFHVGLGGMNEPAAKAFGEQICVTLRAFRGVEEATVEYAYQEIPKEQPKWLGTDSLEEIVTEIEGELYIRADYYVHALSFDDLGISDVRTQEMFTKALNGYARREIAREAVRRLVDNYERLGFLKDHLDRSGKRVEEEVPAA